MEAVIDDEERVRRVWDWILRVMVPVSIAYFGWNTAKAFEMDKRITVIESNRYTPKDALNFERGINQKFDNLNHQLQEAKSERAVMREILIRIDRDKGTGE